MLTTPVRISIIGNHIVPIRLSSSSAEIACIPQILNPVDSLLNLFRFSTQAPPPLFVLPPHSFNIVCVKRIPQIPCFSPHAAESILTRKIFRRRGSFSRGWKALLSWIKLRLIKLPYFSHVYGYTDAQAQISRANWIDEARFYEFVFLEIGLVRCMLLLGGNCRGLARHRSTVAACCHLACPPEICVS